ncbi:MAG: class B sortase [Lachnospiraceae bacterium]
MSDSKDNPQDNISEGELFADVSNLAKNKNMDSGEFLKSLSELIESEKYNDLASDILEGEEAEDTYSKEEMFLDELLGIRPGFLQNKMTPSEEAGESFNFSMSENQNNIESEDYENSEGSNLEYTVDSEETNFEEINNCEDNDSQDESEDNKSDETENVTELTPEEIASRKKKRIFYNALMVVSILVFCYCVYRIGDYVIGNIKYNKQMEKLQNLVDIDITVPEITPQAEVDIFFPDEKVYASGATHITDTVSEKWADSYANLVELNPDCIGWIKIPNTRIDYPVMYTPEQYDKYLYRDFEGNYLYRGLPFMAEGTVLNLSQNYIMYGHHMADGTAFRDLCNYLNYDFATNPDNQYAYFNTAYGEGVYQLMAVVITKVFNVEDECFKYYKYAGELTEDEFNTYVYYMNKMSSINTGVTAVYGDQLISLSTCYRVYDPDGRLVVVFKRIK